MNVVGLKLWKSTTNRFQRRFPINRSNYRIETKSNKAPYPEHSTPQMCPSSVHVVHSDACWCSFMSKSIDLGVNLKGWFSVLMVRSTSLPHTNRPQVVQLKSIYHKPFSFSGPCISGNFHRETTSRFRHQFSPLMLDLRQGSPIEINLSLTILI